MSDSARTLVIAAVLSALTLAALAWRAARAESASAERLIAQLRVAQWAAILLSATGGLPMGLALGAERLALVHLDVALGASYIALAGFMLQRDPPEALLVGAVAFVAHALVDIAHRPGWLSVDLAPQWYLSGLASYCLVLAALCYWARRR